MAYLAFCVLTEEASERVFTPPYYRVYDNIADAKKDEDVEYVEEYKELTKQGLAYYEEYQEDASRGYDLCYGRAYGLAHEYSYDKFCRMLLDNHEYTIHGVKKVELKNVPAWSLNYIINGDSDILENNEIDMIEDYFNKQADGCSYDVVLPENWESSFSAFPAFGLPTDCVDVTLVIYI